MPRLTEFRIRAAKADNGAEVLIADGGNLFLRVRPTGSKVWIVRIKRGGKRRVHTLGPYPSTTLLEARKRAAHLVAVERGDARVTVKEAVEDYMTAIIRPRYRRVNNAEVYARHLQKKLGSLSIDAVRAVDVSRMIVDYSREAPVAAMRMLAFAKGFFSWCVGFGLIERSPIADIQAGAFGVEEQPRARILTNDEIRAFWTAPDLPHRALLRFLLLTGVRIGEAQAAQRDWLHSDGWLDLPADVMKNGKPHRAFVSRPAKQQIELDAAPHLFRTVSPTAVQSALRRWQDRHGIESRWTPHDLRRSFASRLGDLGIPVHIIAKCLGHTLEGGGESTAVYLRSEWLEERKQATMRLAEHVASVIAKQ
ncbi:MAG TPA: integrase family protein [Casimicrobiaceae bacterium]